MQSTSWWKMLQCPKRKDATGCWPLRIKMAASINGDGDFSSDEWWRPSNTSLCFSYQGPEDPQDGWVCSLRGLHRCPHHHSRHDRGKTRRPMGFPLPLFCTARMHDPSPLFPPPLGIIIITQTDPASLSHCTSMFFLLQVCLYFLWHACCQCVQGSKVAQKTACKYCWRVLSVPAPLRVCVASSFRTPLSSQPLICEPSGTAFFWPWSDPLSPFGE